MFFVLGLLMSTALYGIICLLISIFGLHIAIPSLFQVALHPNGFKEIFLAFMFWSPVAYVVLHVINFFMLKAAHWDVSLLTLQILGAVLLLLNSALKAQMKQAFYSGFIAGLK